MSKPIILKEVLEIIPNPTSLIYVDYNENLDNNLAELQQSIHSKSWEHIEEAIDSAYSDYEWESVTGVMKQLRKDIQLKYDLSKSEAKAFITMEEDTIKDKIYENNDSDPFSQLNRNTGKIIFFYDTGYEMESDSWSWKDKQVIAERQRIKKVLGIRGKNNYDGSIKMMIRQATYGGRLVVYFKSYANELLEVDGLNTISFSNAVIAVIDTAGGSGDDCHIPQHSFSLPYNPENVFIDKLIKYSYTYSVCGMSEDWCDATQFCFTNKKVKAETPRSSLNKELDKEAEYKATYKAGGCTTGDMDIKRHRNVTYINNFPCGNKCTDCSTF